MISIIIPLYNKEKTILRCLNSVLGQTYKEFEVIIVDDGSVDNGVSIIENSISDKRVKIIKQKNGGVSKARNTGAKAANGNWLVFLDADDYWLPDFLLRMHDAANNHKGFSLIQCASFVYDEINDIVHTDLMIDKSYHKIVLFNFFRSLETAPHIGASLISRTDFKESGGFNEDLKNNEDILLLGKIAMNKKCLYVGEMLHVYSIGVEGQTTRNVHTREKFAKDSLTVIGELYKCYQVCPSNQLVLFSLSYRFKDILLRFIKNNNYNMVDYYLENVNKDFLSHLFYMKWIKNVRLRQISIIYLGISKIYRILKGIQGRSHKSKYKKELEMSFRQLFKI